MASSVVSSITRMGTIEPFELQVSRGQITGHRAIFNSAYNTTITTNATIWPKNTVYVFPTVASVMTLYSSSVADTTQAVLIEGLNAQYEEISEVLVLNGQTGRTSTLAFFRINKMVVLVDSPLGNISFGTGAATAGIPANTYGYIAATDNASMSAVYTVPAGWTLYIKAGTIASGDATGSQTLTANFYSRVNGVTYLTAKLNLANSYQFFDYVVPLAVPEKTDIYNNAASSSTVLSASVTFNGILIKNNGQT